ncbi:MAG: hypothetical protein U0Q03_00240 [Acidimicrobiales bacterium]
MDELLSRDFVGAAELRRQLAIAMVESSCKCGCGSIGFVFANDSIVPRSPSTNPVPVTVTILAEDGSEAGGLVVLLRDGLLDDADVYSFFDPLPWPDVSCLRWDA